MKTNSQSDSQFGRAGPPAGVTGGPELVAAWTVSGEIFMAAEPETSFAALLRCLRKAAFLTQEDLAHAARLSSRAISDLERGLTRKTRRDTASRLADALNLRGSPREDFVAMALGRGPASGSISAARDDPGGASSRFSGAPREWLSHVASTLDELGVAAARSAVADWQSRGPVDAAWLSWVDALIRLTAEGKLPPVATRPLPSVGGDPFLGREQQAADLNGFLDRIEQGRGGCALVAGPAASANPACW